MGESGNGDQTTLNKLRQSRIVVGRDDQVGLTDAVMNSFLTHLPETWADSIALHDSPEIMEIIEGDAELQNANVKLSSVWLVGNKQESVYAGLESQGLSTLRLQVSGGRLVALMSIQDLLDYFGGSSISAALEKFKHLNAKESIPDSFALPTLCAAYIKTGQTLKLF